MLKRSLLLATGFAALAAMSLSNPAAASTINGLSLNGLSLNGLSLNGLSLNGNSSSGLMFDVPTLQAVRLALPDGTELLFR